jgi:DNA-binding NarL/FixJ family response regulator
MLRANNPVQSKPTYVRSVSRQLKTPLRILLLKDSEADAELIRYELRRSGLRAITERVDSEPAFTSALRDFAPDVVLSDHSLGQFDAESALMLLRKVRPATPLIIVTGSLIGDKAVACLRAGAEDVIIKENLHRLAASITQAVHLRRPLDKLTPRQIEVLQMVADGYRTREIATHLNLSVKTIESHRGEIMKRLEIHDVVGLVRYAMRVGLVAVAA